MALTKPRIVEMLAIVAVDDDAPVVASPLPKRLRHSCLAVLGAVAMDQNDTQSPLRVTNDGCRVWYSLVQEL